MNYAFCLAKMVNVLLPCIFAMYLNVCSVELCTAFVKNLNLVWGAAVASSDVYNVIAFKGNYIVHKHMFTIVK